MIGRVKEHSVDEEVLRLLRAWHPPKNTPVKVMGTLQYMNHQYLIVQPVLSDAFLPATLYLTIDDSFEEEKALEDATTNLLAINEEIEKTQKYLEGLKREQKELVSFLQS